VTVEPGDGDGDGDELSSGLQGVGVLDNIATNFRVTARCGHAER